MRSSKEKKDIVVEVDTVSLTRLVITVLMAAVALFCVFMFVRSFLPVNKFEIDGVMTYRIYDNADLVGAAGIKRGDRLYGIDLDKAEEKILEECVYIEKVELVRKFPNKLVIKVEEKLPHWYIELAGKYYSLDSELEVIEEVASDTSYVLAGVTKLELPNLKRVVVDELPSFGESKLEIEKTVEVVSTLRETPFKSRISGVDLRSRFNIYMQIDGNKEVYMGDATNMKSKIDALAAVIESLGENDTGVAYIDASNPASISFGLHPHGAQEDTVN